MITRFKKFLAGRKFFGVTLVEVLYHELCLSPYICEFHGCWGFMAECKRCDAVFTVCQVKESEFSWERFSLGFGDGCSNGSVEYIPPDNSNPGTKSPILTKFPVEG